MSVRVYVTERVCECGWAAATLLGALPATLEQLWARRFLHSHPPTVGVHLTHLARLLVDA